MKTIILCSILIANIKAATLPSYIERCRTNDPDWNKCLTTTANNIWSKFYKGDSSIHLASMDPMEVNFLNIDVDGNLSLNVSEAQFIGMKDSVFKDVRMDLEKKTMGIQFYCERLQALGKYVTNGKLLALPIVGNGDINVTYVGGTYDYHLEYKMKPDKKGQDHIDIIKSSLQYKIKRSRISLTNLFNNKVLSDHMNVVLNENWKELDLEVGVKVGNGLGEVLTTILQAFFKKVPWKDMAEL